MMESANPSVHRHRKKAELEPGEFPEGVLNAVPDGIFILDPGGIIRFANPAGERLFGYLSGQLTGFSFGSLISRLTEEGPPMSSPGPALARPLEAAEVHWKAQGLCSTGAQIHLRGCCAEIPGSSGSFVVALREIRPASETGAGSELLSRALDQSPFATLIVTPQGKLVHANAVFFQLAGRAPATTLAPLEANSAWQDTERQLADHLARLMPNHGAAAAAPSLSKDSGTDRNGGETVSPIRNATGEITHFLIVDRDLTDGDGNRPALQEGEQRVHKIIEQAGEWLGE